MGSSEPPIVGDQKVKSICDLPNELLVHICENVAPDSDAQCKVFAIIAKVNRLFYALITPLLYSRFEDCCDKHLQLFAHTILSKKGRAELVKHYRGRDWDEPFINLEPGCVTACDDFALDQTLERIVEKHVARFSWRMTPAALSYTLLCLCTNVQRLEVTTGGDLFVDHLLKNFNGVGFHIHTSFEQVQTLTITVEPDRTYKMHNISLLFMLPSLQALTIDMAALTYEEALLPFEDHWKCSSGSSTVRKLNLNGCELPAKWIATMIRSCQSLVYLHQEHFYWDCEAEYYPTILQALSVHQDTLSYLRVKELDGCKRFSMVQSDPSVFLSLRQSRSLTHLDIPLFCLSTRTCHRPIDELLPHCLQSLTVDIRSTREGFSDNFFISLAEATSKHLAKLQHVHIICRIEEYREEGYLPLHFCHIRRMLSHYGVELGYHLEFVQCEFRTGEHTIRLGCVTISENGSAYMEPLLENMRSAGSDGHEMADHSSLEKGCLGNPTAACNSRSADAHRSKRNWGYMNVWTGPSEFENVA